MALKNYNPTSPARRGLILVDKTGLWKGKPVKSLTEGSGATPQQSVERLRSAMHKAQQDMRVGFGDHRIQGAQRVLQLAQDILTRGVSWAPAGNEEAAAAAGEAEAAEVVN